MMPAGLCHPHSHVGIGAERSSIISPMCLWRALQGSGDGGIVARRDAGHSGPDAYQRRRYLRRSKQPDMRHQRNYAIVGFRTGGIRLALASFVQQNSGPQRPREKR
jgi:hypothetical protein